MGCLTKQDFPPILLLWIFLKTYKLFSKQFTNSITTNNRQTKTFRHIELLSAAKNLHQSTDRLWNISLKLSNISYMSAQERVNRWAKTPSSLRPRHDTQCTRVVYLIFSAGDACCSKYEAAQLVPAVSGMAHSRLISCFIVSPGSNLLRRDAKANEWSTVN